MKIKVLLKRKAWLLILLVFLATRLVKISDFPLFCDEAFYLGLAEEIKTDWHKLLSPLTTATQPLFIWLITLSSLVINNFILAGRVAAALVGLLNLFSVYLLLKGLDLKKANLPMALFFTFSPFILVYQRLAMLESLSLLSLTLGIYATLYLLRKPNFSRALLLGLFLSFSILTKATGFLAFPLSLLFSLFFLWRRGGLKKSTLFFLLGCLFSLLIYFVLSVAAAGSLRMVSLYNFSMPGGHLASASFFNLVRIKNNFWRGVIWLRQYFTPLFFYFFIIASLILVFKRSRWGLFFTSWFVLVFSFEIIVARTFFPRYLFPLIIPVVVNPAFFLVKIFKNSRVIFLIMLFILSQAFVFDYQLIFNPEKAAWPGEDRFQFFEDWTSGKGFGEVAAFLAYNSVGKKTMVFIEPREVALFALRYQPVLKGTEVVFSEKPGLRNPIKETPAQLFGRENEARKYIIRNCNQALPSGWPVELVKTVDKSAFCQIRVYQLKSNTVK